MHRCILAKVFSIFTSQNTANALLFYLWFQFFFHLKTIFWFFSIQKMHSDLCSKWCSRATKTKWTNKLHPHFILIFGFIFSFIFDRLTSIDAVKSEIYEWYMLFECSNCTRTQSGINAFYNRFNEPKMNKNIASWIVLSKIMWIAWTSHTCRASNTFHSHNMKSLLALVLPFFAPLCVRVCVSMYYYEL